MSITVITADDHMVVLEGLRLLLEKHADIQVIDEAVTGREVVQKAARMNPAVVIMDIAMPGMNGIEATHQIHTSLPSVRIIILSMHSSAEYIRRAFKAGACGYLLKESTGQELIEAVRTVCLGRRYLSKKIADVMVDEMVSGSDEGPPKDSLENLSPREREILQLVVEGKSSAEIAGTIFLSQKTVETYRSRMMQKLGTKNIADLVRFAIQKGLLPWNR